jgi:hypothetical protein
VDGEFYCGMFYVCSRLVRGNIKPSMRWSLHRTEIGKLYYLHREKTKNNGFCFVYPRLLLILDLVDDSAGRMLHIIAAGTSFDLV